MNTIELTEHEQLFVQHYLAAIDFTETGGDDQPESGTELDEDFLRESVIDCLAFYSSAGCLLSIALIPQAGHDFWLTRNGHGAGFWDGDWPKPLGDRLTKIAEPFGEAYAIFEQ